MSGDPNKIMEMIEEKHGWRQSAAGSVRMVVEARDMSDTEILNQLFETICEGEVVSASDVNDAHAWYVHGPGGALISPTHVVVDADGDVCGAGLSTSEAKANAILREYQGQEALAMQILQKVHALEVAAKKLFNL